MTDTTPEQAAIQADREAAANWYASTGNEDAAYRSLHPVTPTGGALAQAFARHRLAHSQPASEGLREALRLIKRTADARLASDIECMSATIENSFRSISERAGDALQPLTEPQRLGQDDRERA